MAAFAGTDKKDPTHDLRRPISTVFPKIETILGPDRWNSKFSPSGRSALGCDADCRDQRRTRTRSPRSTKCTLNSNRVTIIAPGCATRSLMNSAVCGTNACCLDASAGAGIFFFLGDDKQSQREFSPKNHERNSRKSLV